MSVGGAHTTVRWPRAVADALVELPDGEVLAPRHLHHHLLAALLRVGQRHLGHRPVERERREVDADDVRQRGHAELGMDQRLQPLEFFLRFVLVRPTTVRTPGMILSESGERPHLATRAFRSA